MKSSWETCLHSLCNNTKNGYEFFNQTKKRTFKTFSQVIGYVNFYHPVPFWGHRKQLMAEWCVTFDKDCNVPYQDRWSAPLDDPVASMILMPQLLKGNKFTYGLKFWVVVNL